MTQKKDLWQIGHYIFSLSISFLFVFLEYRYPVLAVYPFILLMFPVTVSALFGGTGPGFLSLLITSIFSIWNFLPYRPEFTVSVIVFALESLAMIWIVDRQRRSHLMLLANNQQVATILESISDGFVAINRAWKFTYINNQAEYILGRLNAQLINHSIWESLPPVTAPIFNRYCQQAFSTQQATDFEVSFPDLNKWYDVHVYPTTDNLTLYFNDITQRKLLDQQKSEFISIAGHELRTPLTSINGYVQILQDQLSSTANPQVDQYFAKLRLYTAKLSSLINDLLDISRFESGHLVFQDKEINFDNLIRSVVQDIQVTNPHHHIILQGSTNMIIPVDQMRLEQVLNNLLINAIKYSPKTDKVVVDLTKDDHNLYVAVRDFGIGIPPLQLPHIFERYYRGSTPDNQFYSGLGLGLYLAREIINHYQGKLWAESQPNLGSTFHIQLPIHPNTAL